VIEITLPTAISTSSQDSDRAVVQSSISRPSGQIPDQNQNRVDIASETRAEENTSEITLAFVASDLVSGLSYIPALSPSLTSFDITGSDSDFGKQVKRSLQLAGYAVDVGVDIGQTEKQLLTTTLNQTTKTPSISEISARLTIDGASIGRKYVIRNASIAAVTSYFVRGIDPSLVDSTGPVISIR